MINEPVKDTVLVLPIKDTANEMMKKMPAESEDTDDCLTGLDEYDDDVKCEKFERGGLLDRDSDENESALHFSIFEDDSIRVTII